MQQAVITSQLLEIWASLFAAQSLARPLGGRQQEPSLSCRDATMAGLNALEAASHASISIQTMKFFLVCCCGAGNASQVCIAWKIRISSGQYTSVASNLAMRKRATLNPQFRSAGECLGSRHTCYVYTYMQM